MDTEREVATRIGGEIMGYILELSEVMNCSPELAWRMIKLAVDAAVEDIQEVRFKI